MKTVVVLKTLKTQPHKLKLKNKIKKLASSPNGTLVKGMVDYVENLIVILLAIPFRKSLDFNHKSNGFLFS